MTNIVQNFDRAAGEYDAHAESQRAMAKALAAWITPEERKGMALEFGAGTGLFTRLMQPWNGIYIATDAAPHMVVQGKINCPAAIWSQMDARQPTHVRRIDWVFACNVMQWLEEPETIFRAWRKIMSAQGHLAVAVLLKDTLGELESVLPEVAPLHWRTGPEWQKLLEGADFRVDRVESWKYAAHYPSALAFLRTIHAMGLAPCRAVGPGRLRSALRNYDRNFATGKGVRATWKCWLARASVV